MIAVREIIMPTPFEGIEEHWPIALSVTLLCLGKCWSKPGEQNMVIPNGEVHLVLQDTEGHLLPEMVFSDFSRRTWSSGLVPVCAHPLLSDTL